jgi:large subunit ribosomal protein L6
MSRIGKIPIDVPSGVTVTIEDALVTVKGSKGTLTYKHTPFVTVVLENGQILVAPSSSAPAARAFHGLTRTLIANMVKGVSDGFSKQLEIIGVGYRAAATDKLLTLQLGFSHPVELPIPSGLKVLVESNTKLTVSGFDKQLVGDFCAKVRFYRKPEPYKGKGVRYVGEFVQRKAGKAGKK